MPISDNTEGEKSVKPRSKSTLKPGKRLQNRRAYPIAKLPISTRITACESNEAQEKWPEQMML